MPESTARANNVICIVTACGINLWRRSLVLNKPRRDAPAHAAPKFQRLLQLHKDGPVFGQFPDLAPSGMDGDASLRGQLQNARDEIAGLCARMAAAEEALAMERARAAALADELAALKAEAGAAPTEATGGDSEMMELFLRFVERE